MKMEKQLFGVTKDGSQVLCYTLTNNQGMTAQILTYGGVLRCLQVPAPEGLRDVVLGFDCLSAYEAQSKYIGVLVGRCANRIAGSSYGWQGKTHFLGKNSGENCLHGGFHGFHEKIWQAREMTDGLLLRCESVDGEEGFPGSLQVEAHYALTDDNALVISFSAVSDADTLVNLTSHSYFNLAGRPERGLGSHWLQIFSGRITEIDENSVPTGRLLAVEDTAFDFRVRKNLGEALKENHPQLDLVKGFDHNYVLKQDWSAEMRLAAVAEAEGVSLECLTTQPGLHLYTANYLEGEAGKAGAVYTPQCAFCLETQNWPDAVHHRHFPAAVLRVGQRYQQTTIYRFTNM